MPTQLEKYISQSDDLLRQIEGVIDQARSAGREGLTATEASIVEDLKRDHEALQAKIAPLADLAVRQQESEKLHALTQTRASNDDGDFLARFDGPADYLIARAEAYSRGGDEWAQFNRIAHQTTADVPGALPFPIVGDLLKFVETARPTVNALTRVQLPPKGMSWSRPILTQSPLAGIQAAEKTELPSQVLKIAPLTVDRVTFGATVNVSNQLDFSDPSALQVTLSELVRVTLQETEKYAFNAVSTAANAAGQTVVFNPATAGVKELLKAVADGTTKVYGEVKALADRILVSPDIYGMLLSLTATDGRPVITPFSPMNNIGSGSLTSFDFNLAGISGSVAPEAPAGTFLLGNSRGFEYGESTAGILSAVEPRLLGTEIASYVYAAVAPVHAKSWVSLKATAVTK